MKVKRPDWKKYRDYFKYYMEYRKEVIGRIGDVFWSNQYGQAIAMCRGYCYLFFEEMNEDEFWKNQNSLT